MDNQTSTPLRFSWRLFWILFTLAILGILASVPAALALLGPVFKNVQPSLPLPVIFAIGAIQNLALLFLFVALGLKLAGDLGLGAPLIHSWLDDDLKAEHVWRATKSGIAGGLFVGLVLLPMILLLARRIPTLPFVVAAKIPIWKRMLACFYGGFYEETFTHLFLLSLVAWLISRVSKKVTPPLGARAFWLANIIVALLFGLGHLPSASLVMPITTLVVVAALILNGVAAVTFGWLYWRRGLEAAMLAHFIADVILWVIGSQLLKA